MNKTDSFFEMDLEGDLWPESGAFPAENSTDGSPYLMMRHSHLISIFLCIAYFSVFVIGIVGNCCVIIIVIRSPRLRHFFIVNLAVADLLMIIVSLPATLLSNLFVPWLLGLFMCKVVSYLQGVVVCASIYTLVAESVNRFLAICYPFKSSRIPIKVMAVLIWTFSLIFASPWVLYFATVPVEELPDVMYCTEVWPDESVGAAYFVVVIVIYYIIPLLIITASYLSIYLKVRKRSIPGASESSKNMNQINVMMTRSKIKTAKMMVIVIVIFVLSWLPLYCVFARIKLGGPVEEGSFQETFINNFVPIAQWLGQSNSCINPILYSLFNKKFRMGFQSIIRSRCCRTIRFDEASSASVYYRQGTLHSTTRSTTLRRVTTTRSSPRVDNNNDYNNVPPQLATAASLHSINNDKANGNPTTATTRIQVPDSL